MASIFSRIIAGEIPCFKLAEDDHHLAFLDINPMCFGHALVVPKIEVDYIFELEDDIMANLSIFAKRVALALEEFVSCKRVGMMVIGTEVPHAHIHLLPFEEESVFDITRPRLSFENSEMQKLADQVFNAFKAN